MHYCKEITVQAVLYFVVLINLPIAKSLEILKQLKPLNKPDPLIGLQLRKESIMKATEFNKGMTFCGRFYFLRFPFGVLMKDPKSSDESSFLWLSVYEKFDILIGGIFFLSYNSGKTNQWNHICLSFDKDACHVAFVKVYNVLKYFQEKEKSLSGPICNY